MHTFIIHYLMSSYTTDNGTNYQKGVRLVHGINYFTYIHEMGFEKMINSVPLDLNNMSCHYTCQLNQQFPCKCLHVR